MIPNTVNLASEVVRLQTGETVARPESVHKQHVIDRRHDATHETEVATTYLETKLNSSLEQEVKVKVSLLLDANSDLFARAIWIYDVQYMRNNK